ncbi:hypothetical protein MRX96_005049 [Rhipicephalus microplus]
MIETDTDIAVACDPYRPKGKMPNLPAGFTAFACEEDPAAIVLVRRPPFDLCPVMLSKYVVGVYGQYRDSHFTIVSVYAPPHKPNGHDTPGSSGSGVAIAFSNTSS